MSGHDVSGHDVSGHDVSGQDVSGQGGSGQDVSGQGASGGADGRPDPDSLDSGASTDATKNSGDEDTASGGPAEPAGMTDPDGTPVENPSG